MARKFISNVANGAGGAVRQANKRRKKTAQQVNRLDRALGGLLLNNPISSQVVPYLNAAGTVLDVFDDMMGTDGTIGHPQTLGGQVAGVSNGLQIRRSGPKLSRSSRGTIRIVHKELVTQVSTLNTGFVATSATGFPDGRSVYHVSPTNSALFPWLSEIAGNYDYFRFKRLRLVYVPTCSTGQTGRTMIAYEPDAIDPIPFDRSALSSYKCSVDCSVWAVSKLDCDLINNQPWYSTDPTTGITPYSSTSQGAIFWATWAANTTADVGEVYVLYDVELKDPTPSNFNTFRANGTGGAIVNNFSLTAPVAWVTDVATTIKYLFTGIGTYLITISGASTAVGAITSGGSLTVVGSSVSNNGALTTANICVRVFGNGFMTAPGISSAPAFVQLNGMTALAAWITSVVKLDAVNVYP